VGRAISQFDGGWQLVFYDTGSGEMGCGPLYDKVLNDSRRQEMWTVATLRDGKPNRANYGFGWFVESQKGHRAVEHDGRWQGFSTQISRYVDDRLTVVVLTNKGNCDPHLTADKVAAIYFGKQSRSK
jgi:hypothetical protein